MNNKAKTTPKKPDGKPALMPKLRFPEFRKAAPWRVRKLNEVLFEAKHRNRTLELGPNDVLSVSREHGCVNQIELLGRSYAGVTVKDYHVVEHGDIVYTKSPLKRNPYGIIKENKGKRGIVSTLYAVYRPFPGYSATYLDHFFSVDYNLNAYLQPIVRKGAKNDMKVNNADVLRGEICVSELPEQQKISKCLSSMNELIAAQAREVDALKIHKKGLMQQLFPCEGETQPRLRFPEFQDADGWGETQLQKIARPVTDRAATGDGDNVLSLSVELGLVLQSDYFTKKVAGDIVERYFKLLRNDFVYNDRTTKASTFGTIKRLSKYSGGIVSPIYKCFRFHPDENPVFWEWYFESGSHDNQLGGLVNEGARSGRFNISITQFLSTFAWCPDAPEQQIIADCLSSLDDLIAAQTQKLETLKTHKKGLMQQLFPSPVEVVA